MTPRRLAATVRNVARRCLACAISATAASGVCLWGLTYTAFGLFLSGAVFLVAAAMAGVCAVLGE